MNKYIKILIILLTAALAVFILGSCGSGDIMDGPGSVYEWTTYELYGDWIETVESPSGSRCSLHIDESNVILEDGEGRETTYSYTLREGTDTVGKPDGEVYLNIEDLREFDDLIFHEQRIGEDELIPVISATLFEYDGRGEIIVTEFVRDNDIDRIPADFRSNSCIERNDRQPNQTYISLDDIYFINEPADSDLIKGRTFYARVPRNRYGGSCEEGDYAEGRFLLWLEEVEVDESGAVVNDSKVGIPHIVSDNGNDENLCMLSGGNDGYKPYGDDIWQFTTDENGEIIDAVYVEF